VAEEWSLTVAGKAVSSSAADRLVSTFLRGPAEAVRAGCGIRTEPDGRLRVAAGASPWKEADREGEARSGRLRVLSGSSIAPWGSASKRPAFRGLTPVAILERPFRGWDCCVLSDG